MQCSFHFCTECLASLFPSRQPPIPAVHRHDLRGTPITQEETTFEEFGEHFLFVNRETELFKLLEHLMFFVEFRQQFIASSNNPTDMAKAQGTDVVLCCGGGGIGKTSFASAGVRKLAALFAQCPLKESHPLYSLVNYLKKHNHPVCDLLQKCAERYVIKKAHCI